MDGASPSQVKVSGLLDTGADVTIVSQLHWPQSWPIVTMDTGELELGGVAQSLMAAKTVTIRNPEGQVATRCLGSMGCKDYDGFLTGATVLEGVRQPTLALTWLPNTPIWVDQWPLNPEKLSALHSLVQEQLQAGHIEPSHSPWNTPIFVIKKKSGKWQLLHDLQEINAVMASMGALQPGLLSPAMIPAGWDILIVDLKDWFFTIPLAEQDKDKFAFSVPVISRAEPVKRYQWKVLPQGMKNSPTICQWFVAQALFRLQEQYPDSYCYHYMDYILCALSAPAQLDAMEQTALCHLKQYGLVVAPEKVQHKSPWLYLGAKILDQTVLPQPIMLSREVKNLNDIQKLMGAINWVRPYLGLTSFQLSPLMELLKGDSDICAPRRLTREAHQVLHVVEKAIQSKYVYRVKLTEIVQVFVLTDHLIPYATLCQWNETWGDPLHVLEGMFLPYRFKKTAPGIFELVVQLIIKTRTRCLELLGQDPATIVIPIQATYFEWCLATNMALQSALADFQGDIKYHLPRHPMLKLVREISIGEKGLHSTEPVEGLTVFTDGSGKTGKAAVTWFENGKWHDIVTEQQRSPQIVELKAVTEAFRRFSKPLNLVTDSAYVAGLVQQLERAVIKQVDNEHLFHLLQFLWELIQKRDSPYYVLHVRSHTVLPRFLAEGNARADRLVSVAVLGPVPNTLQQAQGSHPFFHQGAKALQNQFHLKAAEARAVVASCPDCQGQQVPCYYGVNPRGLQTLQIWQTDVTHIAEFGRLKYVHVSVDTYSNAVVASAHTREKAKDAIRHWQKAFSMLGVPGTVKTNNGPAYVAKPVREFLQKWGTQHVTGIPHSPTGQAIVERAHGTLKSLLQKQKGGMEGEPPEDRLTKAIYVLNFLNVPKQGSVPPIVRHFSSFSTSEEKMGHAGILPVVFGLCWIVAGQPSIPPKWHTTNVWVTLMEQLNQTSFCASLAQPCSPFHTVLVQVLWMITLSKSIHQQIQELPTLTSHIQENTGLLNSWLSSWGLGGWIRGMLKTGIFVSGVVIIVLLMVPCLVSLLQRALQWMIQAVFVAQIQKGGIVGAHSWTVGLTEKVDLDDIRVYPWRCEKSLV
ncbi:endogenous retrovirus group K member 18 Pol protein [Rhynochetos jubatus]